MKEVDKKLADANARLILAKELGNRTIIEKILKEIEQLKKEKNK